MTEDKRIYLDEDTKLMIKASKGDKKAFTVLYNKYLCAVIKVISNRTSHGQAAEDIAQEVFTRIWDNREKYKPTAPFKTYLFKFAKNVLSERLKSRSKEKIVCSLQFLEDSDCPSTKTVDSEYKIEKDNIRESVHLAMSGLTAKQLRCVELIYYMNFTVNKAAKAIGCSEKAFERRLSRARKSLRQSLAYLEQGEAEF